MASNRRGRTVEREIIIGSGSEYIDICLKTGVLYSFNDLVHNVTFI